MSSTAVAPPRLRVAFAGAFAVRLAEPVRTHLGIACDVICADEAEIVSQLPEVDILVTMAFTPEMGAASRRLKLVQVPGAGLDRIDRSAVPTGTWLANTYGHEIGIAEYVIGAMLAWIRLQEIRMPTTSLSQWIDDPLPFAKLLGLELVAITPGPCRSRATSP
jgi:phosphoglycerate dehydrogenase-like enzyme